jgi:hypothetical protein
MTSSSRSPVAISVSSRRIRTSGKFCSNVEA